MFALMIFAFFTFTGHLCYFLSTVDGKVSKHEAIFRPPWTEKRACACYFPSMPMEIYVLRALFSKWTSLRLFSVRQGQKKRACACYFPFLPMEIYVLRVLFSFHRDGKVSKPEAIFSLPWTENHADIRPSTQRLRSGFSIANQIKFDVRFTDLRLIWCSELIVDQLCFVFPCIFDLQLRDRRFHLIFNCLQ